MEKRIFDEGMPVKSPTTFSDSEDEESTKPKENAPEDEPPFSKTNSRENEVFNFELSRRRSDSLKRNFVTRLPPSFSEWDSTETFVSLAISNESLSEQAEKRTKSRTENDEKIFLQNMN